MNSKWQNYWSQQTDPRHAVNQDNFFEEVAREIKFHLRELEGKRVLELGCGDGALLKFLPIKSSDYFGVDFSDSLLKKFKETYPGFQTAQQGAIEYLENCDEQFDIVFSFGVLQYFDESALSKLFKLQAKVLTESGIGMHFGIPVKEQQQVFLTGQGTQKSSHLPPRPFLKQMKSKFKNNIGHWHRLNRIAQISAESGFEPQIFGGMNYLYRINLKQTRASQ